MDENRDTALWEEHTQSLDPCDEANISTPAVLLGVRLPKSNTCTAGQNEERKTIGHHRASLLLKLSSTYAFGNAVSTFARAVCVMRWRQA